MIITSVSENRKRRKFGNNQYYNLMDSYFGAERNKNKEK